MYSISIKDKKIEINNQYSCRQSSMAGTKIKILLNNEEELAYYLFFTEGYCQGLGDSVCTYEDYYNPEGKRLTSKELDNIIEKYFPEETKKIIKQQQLNNSFIGKQLTKLNVISFWLSLEEKIRNNMPENQKKKFEEIKLKNEDNIRLISETNNIILKKKY